MLKTLFLTQSLFSKRFCVSIRRISFNNDVWMSDNVVKSPFRDVVIPDVSLDEYVWKNVDKWATKTAVICSNTKRSYTYEQIYKKSRILGAKLRKLFSIKDGDSVVVILPNCSEYPIVVFGILAAGGVVSSFNPMYTEYEMRKLLNMSDAKLVITTPTKAPTVKKILDSEQRALPIISFSASENTDASFQELFNDDKMDIEILKDVKRSADDVCLLPFSSGTTGLPKGVQLTNRNIVANCEQQNTECRQYSFTTETNQDTLLVPLPLFHSFGLSILMLHKMSVGLKLIIVPKYNPDDVINVFIDYEINNLYLVPPMVQQLGTHAGIRDKHLRNVKSVMVGAAPLPKSDIYNFLEKCRQDVHFCQGYGLTETSPLATISPVGYKNYTSVGFAIPNVQLSIVDENMMKLGPDQVGELLIKGPNIMKGYKDNPQANSEVFLEGGWFRSGDLAKIDKSGAVTITDRLKELIKVNAYQVPPAELEDILKQHPDILDVAVVGVPDSVTGEKPKAFVVLKENNTISEKNIMEFVANRVAPYKKLKEVVFVENIPKNPSGKILRRILKEKYC